MKKLTSKHKMILCVAALSAVALGCVLICMFWSRPTAVAISVALVLTASLLLLPLIRRFKLETENRRRQERARARGGPSRLLPTDKGKVLQFPGKKK